MRRDEIVTALKSVGLESHVSKLEALIASSIRLKTQQAFGDPGDRGAWSVIYHANDDPAPLKRTAAPANLPANARFQACTVGFSSELTLPQRPMVLDESLGLTDAEWRAYSEWISQFPSPQDRA